MCKGSVGLGGGTLWLAAVAFAATATGCFGDSGTGETKGAAGSNPAADIDQCGNGPLDAPRECTGSAWVNGNLNHNQAHYFENESVPYRLKFSNLATTGTHTVRIEWDTTENAYHATDYLTSFDRTETTTNPCSGVSGCDLSSFSTYPIPIDPLVAVGADDVGGTADDIAQVPGVFTLFGGTITDASVYTIDGTYDGSSQTSISITFSATVENPVLAWAGHISYRADWDPDLTAVSIPGSPFHMRLLDLDGSGGNQDRSLAASAVFYPPELIVIKHVINDEGGTATASDFTMTVTGDTPTPASFPGEEAPGTVVTLNPGAYSVSESNLDNYESTLSADCSGTIDYDETKTCTITNNDINRCADVTCDPPGECQLEGVCNPATGICEYPDKEAGTECSDDGLLCTDDVCDDQGACTHPPGNEGLECRASTGVCDPAESCNGIDAGCPEDLLEPATTVCHASAGDCDPAETCTGFSADCPTDQLEPAGTVCHASAGACDPVETCTGVDVDCPTDQLAPAGTVCHASAGDCDPAETCTGFSADCPSDQLEPAGTVCHASAGDCDPAETCTGDSADCPTDQLEPAGTVCHESAGDCDPAETCTGVDVDCPTDQLEPAGTVCRAAAGVCDRDDVCDGIGVDCPEDGFLPAGTECRASADECDPAESCTGSDADCPEDVNGTCSLCGNKFYDANANSSWDDGEAGVDAWKITVTDQLGASVSTTTDATGAYLFDALATGTYTVCEEYPLEDNWMQTAPAEGCYDVTIPTTHGLCMYDFGNLCLGAGGGHTPGFWSNKNGLAAFYGTDDGVGSLWVLQSLNLWDEAGNAFNPTTYFEYAKFAEWLLDGTAVNMAYMLSVHVAAMALNVHAQFVDPDALVYAPGVDDANALGFITIGGLINEANAELALHGYTPSGSPYRAYQEALKNALDAANNNQNFVQSGACAHSFEAALAEGVSSGIEPSETEVAPLDGDSASEPSTEASGDFQASESTGGCSTGGDSSPWGAMLLMAMLLGLARRRRDT